MTVYLRTIHRSLSNAETRARQAAQEAAEALRARPYVPKAGKPLCGARKRNGEPCQGRGKGAGGRCKYHGGKSTGPRTPEGRARIAESNRRRARARVKAAVAPGMAAPPRSMARRNGRQGSLAKAHIGASARNGGDVGSSSN